MAKSFRLIIELGNAALDEENRDAEIARILRETSERIAEHGASTQPTSLYDINGNRVGHFKIGSR